MRARISIRLLKKHEYKNKRIMSQNAILNGNYYKIKL